MIDESDQHQELNQHSPFMTFEEARIDHLLRFAATTPGQKLQWLADMLEFVEMARVAREPIK